MILAIGIGWRYAPQDARQKLLEALGVARRGYPRDIAQEIKDKIVPEDPAAHRAALAAALEQKITQIKNIAAGKSSDVSSGQANTTVEQAADEAGQLVQELENANKDPSISGQIVQRALDRILPASQCKSQ